MEKNHESLNLIALMEFSEYENMYKIVDFLNKNLKQKGIIFGLTRKNGKDVISIYDGEVPASK
ncbi:Protein of unknown function [Caloramator quimbayensis]|uniref:DUF4264 domain-containing protein n=1 Tax=Caloramator quimbayensis TaxID=1147123 RepID=A0A1T4X0R0_9CLOT|nr:YpmA family protein [Caloramator quimbayensis]SKA83144.1 Protein of unknown function [Caloramator quimbayensis]